MSGVSCNTCLLNKEGFKLPYVQAQAPEVEPQQVGSFRLDESHRWNFLLQKHTECPYVFIEVLDYPIKPVPRIRVGGQHGGGGKHIVLVYLQAIEPVLAKRPFLFVGYDDHGIGDPGKVERLNRGDTGSAILRGFV